MTRLFTAIVGASIVTVVLLLAMNEIVNKFRERDGTRYFLVDFIQPVETGRRRVQRLEIPESATERPRSDLEVVDPGVEFDRPAVGSPIAIEESPPRPELDPSAVEPDAP